MSYKLKSQRWPSKIKKIINTVYWWEQGALYTQCRQRNESRKYLDKEIRIKKITDLVEEGKTEIAVNVNAGMKTRKPFWNDLLCKEGKIN